VVLEPKEEGRGSGQIKGAGIDEAGFAGVAAFDAANAEEFFAAALEVGFGFLDVGGGNDDDHADAHIEGLQQFVGIDFAEFGEIFEDRRNGPRIEIDDGFDAAGQDAGKIAGNAAAGDVRESGDPALGDETFERGGVADVGFH